MYVKSFAAAGAMALLTSTTAMADGHACAIDARVSIVGNEFPAIQTVGAGAQECQGGDVSTNLTADHQSINVPGMQGNPAEYTSAIIANSSIVALLNEDVIRPLDDLVAEYGDGLASNQLITIDGQVMAVAFMANYQHHYARTDILEEAGVAEIPTTLDEIVAAAEAIRAAGIMEHPIVMNATGWNLGELFNLFYFGHDGQLFEAGSAEPAINNETGVAALEAMAALAEYAHPDYLSHASNETQALWEAGQAALGIMWGSRGGAVLDDEGSSPEVTENTVLTGAPTVTEGGTPVATLWWDGVTIATNISDEEAEAAFAALVGALNADMVAENNDDAIWLIDGYMPGPAASGVTETVQLGARPYPMIPYINLMHNAAGAEVADFLQGEESAEETLADIEAAYRTAAIEAGFLQE